MHDPALIAALASGLMPRETPNFPDWADANIMLKRGGDVVPWETSKTPYIRLPMLVASVDSPVEEIVVQKPSQTGFSEAFAVAFFLYMAAIAPCDMLQIRPDLDEAARFKKMRIDSVIDASPNIRGLVREKKSRDAGNTMHQLLGDGWSWTTLGSNSPAGMASIAAAVVLFDEADRMAASAGVGVRAEGDQYLITKRRTETFKDSYPRRKLIQISTPGERSTSKIAPAWEASNRGRFWVPCSQCGEFFVHSHKRLWWGKNDDPRTARYRCQVCDRLLDERDKPEQLARGEWRFELPTREVFGFKLVGLDSPFMRWGEIAAEKVEAKGNPHKTRVHINTVEGETYDSHEATKVDVAALKLLAFKPEWIDGRPAMPRAAGWLTTGTDVQGNRLETQSIAWGRGEEQWILDQVIMPGDTSSRAPDGPWSDLDVYQSAWWPRASGGSQRLNAGCVDTGGESSLPASDYVRHKGPRKIVGVKGGKGRRFWPRHASRSKWRTDLFVIWVDPAKAQLYARLKASVEQVQRGDPPGGPGFVHIAAHLCEDVTGPGGVIEPSEFLRQLVAEHIETKTTKSGDVISWVLPSHTRNEALDCNVYAQAALAMLKSGRKSLERAVERAETAAPTTPPPEKIGISSQRAEVKDRDNIPPRPTPAPVAPAPVAAPRFVPRYILPR